MAFIAPVVGAVGAAIGAVGSFITGLGVVGQAVLGIGLSVAASYATAAIGGKQKAQPGGVQFERQYGSAVPRQVACGLVGIAGHDCYVNTYGPSNYELQQVYALSDYPCDGLSRVAINGEWVLLEPTESSINRGRQVISGPYAGLIWIKFLDGTQTEAQQALTMFANPGGRWTADHIGIGVCKVVVSMTYNEERNASFPHFFFELRGARFYDWRKDSTVGGSGGHRWGDYATHEFTENPIVIEYNYRRGISINGDLFCGMAMPASDLLLDKWTAAANLCDEAAAWGPRYRCSVMLDCEVEHGENISSLQMSCGADTVDAVDGSWPLVGHDQPIVLTITDDDLISTEPVRWRGRRSMSELVNTVSGNFPNPDSLWSMLEYETQTSGTLVTLDRRDRDIAIDFPQVRVAGQAANLAAIYLMENRYEATADIVLRPRFMVLEPGDWIRWNSGLYGNRVYVVKDIALAALDAEGPRNVTVSLEERDGAIYDGVTAPPIVLPWPPGQPQYLAEVQSFSVVPIILQGNDGRLLPGIRAAWETIDDVTVTAVDVLYYPTAQPEAVIVKTVPTSQTVLIIGEGLVANTQYMVKTRLRTEPARVVAWSAGEKVTTNDISDATADRLRLIEQHVTEVLDPAVAASNTLKERLAELLAEQDAQNWLDKEEWGFQLTATHDRVTASFTEKITVVAGEVSAIASHVEELAAEMEGLNSDVTFRSVAAVSLPAGAMAAYEVVAKASDTISTSQAALMIAAYADGAGGAYSVVRVDSDRFIVVNRVNGTSKPVFSAIGGEVFITGNMYAPGSITAAHLNVVTLDAISVQFGTMRGGRMLSLDGKYDHVLGSYEDWWS